MTTTVPVQSPRTAPVNMGAVLERTDIRSSVGPFHVLPDYVTVYPDAVVSALASLYAEYNRAFAPLVASNREWESDYKYCFTGGVPVNALVQIDMLGLPQRFLDAVDSFSSAELKRLLRGRIFEIENSLAMYQMLERFGVRNGNDSFFRKRFRAVLDGLRLQHGRPIALLAVTDAKYEAMRATEFGKQAGESLSHDEVHALSGFDALLGPQDFLRHLAEHGGECQYLLYARTSDPVSKLKDPEADVEHPLLSDADLRRIIKANALTFNVDDPAWSIGDARRINDTKDYMPTLGMAYRVGAERDLFSADLTRHLLSKKSFADFKGQRLNDSAGNYFRGQDVDPDQVAAGIIAIRGKPAQGTYGCYGHVSGTLDNDKFRHQFRSGLRRRGAYMIQPELQPPAIINAADGAAYFYIDRNFFGYIDGKPVFLGGVRSMMPADSQEARRHRNHGNASTVIAEIVCE